MIEVTDLVKNYGSVPAVRGVSLGVARGEVSKAEVAVFFQEHAK